LDLLGIVTGRKVKIRRPHDHDHSNGDQYPEHPCLDRAKKIRPRVLTDPPCKRDGIVAAFAAAEIANPEINEITISGVVDKRNKNCFMFYIYYLVSTFKKEAVFIS